MSRIPSIEVNGFEPWMSQVISSNTVRNALIVTNRTPLSISRRASRQHWPNRVMPYRSRVACRFLGQVERLAGLGAGHQPERRLEVAVEQGGVLGGLERGRRRRRRARGSCAGGRAGRCRSPWAAAGRERGSRACEGSALSDERVVRLAQEPAGLAVGHVAAAAAHQFRQHDEGRQVGLAALRGS